MIKLFKKVAAWFLGTEATPQVEETVDYPPLTLVPDLVKPTVMFDQFKCVDTTVRQAPPKMTYSEMKANQSQLDNYYRQAA